jgi:hypothetical protein
VLLVFEVENTVVRQSELAANAFSTRRDVEGYDTFWTYGDETVYLTEEKDLSASEQSSGKE